MSNSQSNLESFEKQKIARLEADIVELKIILKEQKKTVEILLAALGVVENASRIGLTLTKTEIEPDRRRRILGSVKQTG